MNGILPPSFRSAPRRLVPGALVCVLAACGPSTQGPLKTVDAAMVQDDGPRRPDLAAAADLTFPGTLLRYVVSHVDLPAMKGQYGFDENGDNTVDNQLQILLSALSLAGFSFMQASENLAVTVDGSALELVSLATFDATAQNDGTAYATLYAGRPQKFPDLGGTGSFGPDLSGSNGGAGRVGGALAGGTFTTPDPARLVTDVTAPLRLGFWSSKQATLPLHGAQVTFTVSASGLMNGQIHGVVSADDVHKVVVATLAADLSAIESRANCAADAECRAVKKSIDLDGDGKVDADEIDQGPLGPSLRPDVEMFDAMGRYAPAPSNTNRNAWSVGVAFSAVKATFPEP